MGIAGGAYGGAYSAVLLVDCLAQRRRIRTAFRLNFRGSCFVFLQRAGDVHP